VTDDDGSLAMYLQAHKLYESEQEKKAKTLSDQSGSRQKVLDEKFAPPKLSAPEFTIGGKEDELCRPKNTSTTTLFNNNERQLFGLSLFGMHSFLVYGSV